MAIRYHTIATVGLTAIFTAGCSLNLFNRGDSRPPPPAPLVAAPAGTVTGAPLPPPGGTVVDGTVVGGPMVGGTAVGGVPAAPTGLAALDPNAAAATATPLPAAAAGGGEIGRTDLLGGWTIAAAGSSCQLFMTLTTWAGGYRASTRGCADASFQGISAWNLESGQVQLLNDAGTTVARLIPASKTQLNGQTSGGGPVSVTR